MSLKQKQKDSSRRKLERAQNLQSEEATREVLRTVLKLLYTNGY